MDWRHMANRVRALVREAHELHDYCVGKGGSPRGELAAAKANLEEALLAFEEMARQQEAAAANQPS